MKNIFKRIVIYILTLEAKVVLWRHKPKVVAITGSLGKTGTKDTVAAVLAMQYSVRKSPKSFNSEFGIPLTILGLPNAWNNPLKWLLNSARGFFTAVFSRTYEDIVVLEIGADKPGDIASVATWLQSDVVIITAVPEVPVHKEFYPTADAVLTEKASLIRSLKQGGILITGTDEQVSTLENPHGTTIRIPALEAEIYYEHNLPAGMQYTIGDISVTIPGILGAHQGFAPAFAFEVGNIFSISKSDMISAIQQMQRTPGRMRLLAGKNGSVLIDDSYNSSPSALHAALLTLGQINTQNNAKKIAILGDMRELGNSTDVEHRRAGIQAAHIVDELYTLGPSAKILAEAAIAEGLTPSQVHIYNTHDATHVGKTLASNLHAGDIVLIKSSQGQLRLEQAVKELLYDPHQATHLLVRQEKEWKKR